MMLFFREIDHVGTITKVLFEILNVAGVITLSFIVHHHHLELLPLLLIVHLRIPVFLLFLLLLLMIFFLFKNYPLIFSIL